MINKNDKILIGVSGGVDSMALLLFLAQEPNDIAVAHFDHGIREDSYKDVKLIEEVVDKLEKLTGKRIPIYLRKQDVEEYANKHKLTVELAGRELRYEFFNELREELGYKWLALGHHMDDQAETVMFNFIRGSSFRGLAGMLSIDEDRKIYRPFLNETKQSLIDYMNKAGVVWSEDETNTDTKYDRNFMRHEIMPRLNSRRNVTKVLSDTADRMAKMGDYFDHTLDKWFEENGYEFHTSVFFNEHEFMRSEIIGRLWEHYNGTRQFFSENVVYEVERWLKSSPQGGTSVYFGSGCLTIRKNVIYFIDNT